MPGPASSSNCRGEPCAHIVHPVACTTKCNNLRQVVTKRQFWFQLQRAHPMISRRILSAGGVEYVSQVQEGFRKVWFERQGIPVFRFGLRTLPLILIKNAQIVPYLSRLIP